MGQMYYTTNHQCRRNRTGPWKRMGFEHPVITTAHVTSFNNLQFGKTTQNDVHRLWY